MNSQPYTPEADPAPGADDDCSGVAAVLAIAERVVALLPEPPALRPRGINTWDFDGLRRVDTDLVLARPFCDR